MNKIAFKVKKTAEKSILQGHPWVYESSIVKQNREGKAGDLAVIFRIRDNRFLAVGLYDPSSPIRIRVLANSAPVNIDQAFFTEKIKLALAERSELLKTDTTAYRLIYGENDGLSGLIIDIYNDHAVVKLYSEVWVPYLTWIKEILVQLLAVEVVLLRLSRNLQKVSKDIQDGEVIYGDLKEEEVLFKEHGLLFKANLMRGHKTGYFLDHRHNRLKVRKLSKGRSVLDIFSYAGGFSINAIAGGAKEVLSLDVSKQALEIASENANLNFKSSIHHTMAVDAFEGIQKLRYEGRKFDLIIVDPPSFAKSEAQMSRAMKSYRRLVGSVLPILRNRGILLMASCSSRIAKEQFYDLVINELIQSSRKYEILEKTAHDIDHPEGIKELSYLKAIFLKVN